jgi:aspartyl/glutamyl-tRNA(Asn/Gln) amidotransferase C subunit
MADQRVSCQTLLQCVYSAREMLVQADAWAPQLARVTDFFQELRSINVVDVPPCLHASPGEASYHRADIPETHPMAEHFLEMLPDREGALIKVPKIATAADQGFARTV